MDVSAYNTLNSTLNNSSLSNNTNSANSLNSVNERLTSGSQVNQAADNPATLAIITALSTQADAQDVASRNANSGIGLLQTADGASEAIAYSLQRMNELSLQSMNGTLSSGQRSALNQEFQQSLESINQISEGTQFNGEVLLSGDLNGDATNLEIALGDTSSALLSLPNLTADGLNLGGLNISNPASATLALEGIGLALEQVGNARSQFGAQQNSLSSAIDNLQNQNVNTLSTRSQLNDTDIARASAEQSRLNILNESSIALMSQGNQSKSSVLQLLGT